MDEQVEELVEAAQALRVAMLICWDEYQDDHHVVARVFAERMRLREALVPFIGQRAYLRSEGLVV